MPIMCNLLDIKDNREIVGKLRVNEFFKWQGIKQYNVMGWQNRLKFVGKTNRLKISLQNAYLANFVCFFNISDRNLIILYKFTWKLPFCVR